MITIQQLSQELGIGADTLRVWERRFGFPRPERDTRGHRLYPDEQVEHLRIIKKLQNLGHRPKQIFALSTEQRQQLLHQQQRPVAQIDLDHLIIKVSSEEIEEELRRRLAQKGLRQFVHQVAVPLIDIMDHRWVDGSLSIAREHLLSDMLAELLKEHLQPQRQPRGRIIFLTLSGERHKLGLLLSAALFHCEGLDCILIGEELPLLEVEQMVTLHGADAVALSFSVHSSTRQAKQDLAWLRKNLPERVKVIAGGYALRNGMYLPGISVCTDLNQIGDLCAREFPALNMGKYGDIIPIKF